jgi:glycosyltransferase involved in cell wall biosynthesis
MLSAPFGRGTRNARTREYTFASDSGKLPWDLMARVLFVVNADWFFLSHRLPLAIAARNAGAEVTVVAGDTGKSQAIRDHGLGFIDLPISRSGTNPLSNARTLGFLLRLYRRLRPDLVHHVTVKPIIYGSIAARVVGQIAVVNAISGLAYTFTSDRLHARMLRPLVTLLYRFALRDRDSRVVRPEQAVLIRGSGVDCSTFAPTPEPDGAPIVMFPARLLREKGIAEFVEAADQLLRSGHQARFVLVGDFDPINPGSIDPAQLEAWTRQGLVESWGHRSDMASVLAGATIVVLPAYREGLPKVLLEAAASARAIVATDVPGCREIVRSGINGLLVPARDSRALADAIATLLQSRELRQEFGRAGRAIAVKEFAEEIVVDKTLALYRVLLRNRWPDK